MRRRQDKSQSARPNSLGRFVLVLYGIAAILSLACEMLWMKRLALVFGVSTPAVGTTLAVYILGAVVGSLWVGRDERLVNGGLKTFAATQLFVGLWTLALPWSIAAVDARYGTFATPSQPALQHLWCVVGAVAVLLPPAIAMGMVFPLLSRVGVARLMSVGLLGSTIGALAGTTLIFPHLGFTRSFIVLGVINITLAVVAHRLPLSSSFNSPITSAASCSEMSHSTLCRLTWAAALVGLALFMAEAVWFKLLWLLFDQTAHAEALVVAAVLLAMAGGSALAIKWKPTVKATLLFTAITQLALIVCMEPLAQQWAMHRPHLSSSFLLCLAAQFGVTLVAVSLPAMGYGLSLARMCESLSQHGLGKVWSAHCLGCVGGALVAAFWMLPTCGITLTLGIATIVIAGLTAVYGGRWSIVALAGATLVVVVKGDATFRTSAAGDDHTVVFHHEDSSGIVEVYQRHDDGAKLLVSNRLLQEGGSAVKQVWAETTQGQLSVAMQPSNDDVLVIGLGTGITLSGMLDDTVDRVTCVELSEGIVDATTLFEHENHAVLDDERVRIVLGDGRSFIRLGDTQYNLLVQELFHPYRAGAAALYTREHFARCRARLKDGGRMIQWIHTIQITPDDLRCLVRTFGDVFGHVSMWLMNGQVMLVGGDTAPKLSAESRALEYFIASNDTLRKWAADAPLNTDDNLFLESRYHRHFERLNTTALAIDNLTELLTIHDDIAVLDNSLPPNTVTASNYRYQGMIARFEGRDDDALIAYDASFQLNPHNEQTREYLLQRYLSASNWADAVAVAPHHHGARYNWGIRLYRAGAFAAAEQQFAIVVKGQPEAVDALFNLANCRARLRHYPDAAALYRQVLKLSPRHRHAQQNLDELSAVLPLAATERASL